MMMNINFKKKYPLLPLRNVVIFPHMTISLYIGRDRSIKALNRAIERDRLIILAAQVYEQVIDPEVEDIYEVGTISEILQVLKIPDGTMKILVKGITRGYMSNFEMTDDEPVYVSFRDIEDEVAFDSDITALREKLLDVYDRYIKFNSKIHCIPGKTVMSISSIKDISQLADVIASKVELKVAFKQSILESGNVVERIKKLIALINDEIRVIENDV